MFWLQLSLIVMCSNYRCNIFTLLVLLVFLTNLSELLINAKDVSQLLGNKTSIKNLLQFYISWNITKLYVHSYIDAWHSSQLGDKS